MSLRTRLIAGLLALAAIGLLLLAGVTYAEQRHFLVSRVDDQARQAARWTLRGGSGPLGSGYDNGNPMLPPADGDYDDGGGGPGRHGGPGAPAGTWVVTRSSGGDEPQCVGCLPGSTATAPTLPKNLSAGGPTTVKATNSGASYRIYGVTLTDGSVRFAAVPLEDTEATLHRLLRIEGTVIVGILLALGALAWWLVSIGLRPLERIGRTAGAIAAGDLSRRVQPAEPRTEVGRLGLALNRMLERLEEAFSKQRASEDRLRTFLADASHELRTPLASIRGYAELFRIGAARDPEDTEKAMARIEAEAARMGVLVEDLLTLARLDEVRELIREDVDLAKLAGDAVDDARATAPDRDIDLQAAGHVHVVGDPHQLRQVLANLLRNALVHTPPGTPIEVDARDEGSWTVLEVRDHGPGLPTDENDQLFERFWRAEGGRKQGKAGSGLGLAIVAGIVAAHHGEVKAENAAGGGARFVVRLPLEGGGDAAPEAPPLSEGDEAPVGAR
ncbi:MAG TPA: HAMP domain-containing sensor histidine kinase [Baekduia sp.]|uniref:sensor histidine kinase n=1 Tax=Baekduia sp. TaxID=2600305 RepID=UPI002D78D5FC|nr:HAMP domain-containing sensor histidine kinase [Baekduia sp.]HET6506226.1 HAMP domain-containing sensor histidine kinase [Baekduia sp.]